jgi:hypothetical protein
MNKRELTEIPLGFPDKFNEGEVDHVTFRIGRSHTRIKKQNLRYLEASLTTRDRSVFPLPGA